jgi:hypothetical protein
MPPIKLSLLSIVLGLIFGLPHIYGVMQPARFGAMMRKFPRHTPVGYGLMLLATFWFLMNLRMESVSDFIAFKPALFGLFALVGIGACLFVRDFLPVRGLAVLFLLLAKLMVDSARWVDSEWRLVIVTWAYVLVVAGIWFTVSPWRLRDIINWSTANEQRVRLLSGLRLAFGVLVVVLGLTVFRGAEKKAPVQAFLKTQQRASLSESRLSL